MTPPVVGSVRIECTADVFVEAGQGGGDLRHLHQAEQRLPACGRRPRRRPRPAAACSDSALDGAGDFFADDRTHGTADEVVFHGREDDGIAFHASLNVHNCLEHADLLRQRCEAVLVWLAGLEFQRVGRVQRRVLFNPAGVHKQVNTIECRDLVVITALRADLKIAFQVLFPKWSLASQTLDPKAFRNDAAFVRNLDPFLLAFEPSHKTRIISAEGERSSFPGPAGALRRIVLAQLPVQSGRRGTGSSARPASPGVRRRAPGLHPRDSGG